MANYDGILNSAYGRPFIVPVSVANSGAAATNLALDSAYTYESAGDAFFFAFVPKESGNLTDFWLKVASYTGSWASTDGVLNVQVRLGLNGNNKPGTSLVGSFSVTLDGSTTGWVKQSGLGISLTAGTMYSIVIADADGGATNFVTIVRCHANAGTLALASFPGNTSTADGYATAGTTLSVTPTYVLKQAGLLYGGSAHSIVSTLPSSTNERGLRFKLPYNATLVGAVSIADSSGVSAGMTLKLYADAVAPGGETIQAYTPALWTLGGATAPVLNSILFPAANHYDLLADTWYRFVCKPTANATTPRKSTIDGNPDADVLAATQSLGGNCYYTIENSGGWDDDQASALLFAPILVPGAAAAAGGSGGVSRGRIL